MPLRALLLAAFAVVLAAQPPLPKINESGYQRLLAAQKGQVVLIDFWATWCVPCRKEMPELAKLAKRLGPRGLRLIPISGDEIESSADAVAFLKQSGVTSLGYLKAPVDEDAFHRAVDPKWGGELPALVLYDKAGKKVKIWKGETSPAAIEAAITPLL